MGGVDGSPAGGLEDLGRRCRVEGLVDGLSEERRGWEVELREEREVGGEDVQGVKLVGGVSNC